MIEIFTALAIVALSFAQVMTCFTLYLIGKKIDSVLHLIKGRRNESRTSTVQALH